MKLFPSIPRHSVKSHPLRTWSMRALLLAFVLAIVPLSQAHAGVLISVNIAPPVLPVYEQPPCPEPDLIWVPGYWAYDYDAGGYYWVPGAWVPAPYEGALWTPPYWGWDDGVYMFHPGYWGTEVGYYGGVNYGFGYMGIGFVGGRWDNDHFAYNTAVVHVNQTVIHNTYINNTIVQQNTVINNNHVAYTGGPGGIRHEPTPQERQAMAAPHQPPTQYQQQHIQAARSERSNFYNANHGHPQQVALARPLPAAHYQPPAVRAGGQVNATGRPGNANGNAGVNARPGSVNGNAGARGEYRPNNEPARPMPNNQPSRPMPNNQPGTRPAPEARPENRPAPQPRPQYQPAQPQRPAPDYRPAPQQQPQQRPESRPAPEYRPAPQQQPQQRPESRPAPEYRPQPQQQPRPESRPQQESRPAPQARPESRPAPPPREESHPRPESKPKEPHR